MKKIIMSKVLHNLNTIQATSLKISKDSLSVNKTPFVIFQGHTKENFHLVAPSPWPLMTASSLFALVVSFTAYMHAYLNSLSFLFFGLFLLTTSMGFWFRDITREATFEGNHTSRVQLGLRMGMILFIISEVMFFFAFFWAFFHSSVAPAVQIGCCWPPKGIETFNAFGVPFLNTVILLSSGATVTWAHHAILAGDRQGALLGLISTIALAIIFTGFQYYEYSHASFTIADSVYGSCFYMATGFHGAHVIVGTIMLAVSLVRLVSHHFTKEHHFGFEAAVFYWHFVDVVWLFLFVSIYYWGGN
jgi:cytochrome c oxidase subunit 3